MAWASLGAFRVCLRSGAIDNYLGGGFTYFLFSPIFWGRLYTILRVAYFSKGLVKNHQVVIFLLHFVECNLDILKKVLMIQVFKVPFGYLFQVIGYIPLGAMQNSSLFQRQPTNRDGIGDGWCHQGKVKHRLP